VVRVPRGAPFTRTVAYLTPPLSVAVALTVTRVPETEALLRGEVMTTLGFVVS